MNYLSEIYGNGGIYAKVITASEANNIPIYTLEVKAPKFIDAEFEKHRMISSNSSSSRAIPFNKLNEFYLPFDVRKNQKGMQGYEKSEHADAFREFLIDLYANQLNELMLWKKEIHKQHLNRYIEPWMYQTKVVTATELDNFFNLRLASDAQPEIQELARCMKEAINIIDPIPATIGYWHLPYIDISKELTEVNGNWEILKKCSVARCARVSYKNHDKSNPSIEKDLELYKFLLNSGHLTPFEHQSTPMYKIRGDVGIDLWPEGVTHMDEKGRYWSGNFRGWIQYRQTIQSWN